jgi:hypothetical protein
MVLSGNQRRQNRKGLTADVIRYRRKKQRPDNPPAHPARTPSLEWLVCLSHRIQCVHLITLSCRSGGSCAWSARETSLIARICSTAVLVQSAAKNARGSTTFKSGFRCSIAESPNVTSRLNRLGSMERRAVGMHPRTARQRNHKPERTLAWTPSSVQDNLLACMDIFSTSLPRHLPQRCRHPSLAELPDTDSQQHATKIKRSLTAIYRNLNPDREMLPHWRASHARGCRFWADMPFSSSKSFATCETFLYDWLRFANQAVSAARSV